MKLALSDFPQTMFPEMALVCTANPLHHVIFRIHCLNMNIGVVKLDPWLEPFSEALKRRYARSHDWINRIKTTEGGLEKFAKVGTPKIVSTILCCPPRQI